MDYINLLKEKGYGYLLHFFNKLDEEQKKNFISDLKNVDFDYMKKLAKADTVIDKNENIEPLKGVKKEDFSDCEINNLSEIGRNIITSCKYAIVTLAGRTRNKTWT